MKVELVYDLDCPNVALARRRLLEGFARAGASPHWQEWNRNASDCPPQARCFGSPAILVNGKDVEGSGELSDADCCRLYIDGAPGPEQVSLALNTAAGNGNAGGWRKGLLTLPGIGFAFLPKLACPLCWPAYTGFLSSLGLGFLAETVYLLPLTLIFLSIALGALAFRARQRRGYAPFALGFAAAAVMVFGKFQFESDPALYAGIVLLIAASLWNAWPSHTTPSEPACPDCPS
ncbi:MAG: MerC domain-containing protein [Verrucomicrobia subdivision 3 bacterium]|nr:MerC domain-containing protein [Limisphaerales bacterium]